jgi:Holliday junction resolvase
MATTPEGKVKDKIKKVLKERGIYFVMPATGGYGSSGAPDILVCHRGMFYGIECKAGDNKPTALQKDNLNRIEENGGYAFVINETDVDDYMKVYFND